MLTLEKSQLNNLSSRRKNRRTKTTHSKLKERRKTGDNRKKFDKPLKRVTEEKT